MTLWQCFQSLSAKMLSEEGGLGVLYGKQPRSVNGERLQWSLTGTYPKGQKVTSREARLLWSFFHQLSDSEQVMTQEEREQSNW